MKFFRLLFLLSLLIYLNQSLSGQTNKKINIDIWYGDTQYFGQHGNPQKWINILGNISAPDGIKTFSYSLNGKAFKNINIGPDTRRLQNPGDFNIDISVHDLLSDTNLVEIKAIDRLGNETFKTVNVIYKAGNIWNQNYEINWDTVTNIQNVAQVVDGKWELTGNGIRITEAGYDRLIAIGDTNWTNYEVTTSITINSLEPPISPVGGNIFGCGLLMRFTGHSDDPVSGWQPKSGYKPLGEIGWFSWNKAQSNPIIWFCSGNIKQAFNHVIGTTYNVKMRVVSIPGEGHLCNLKIWESGTEEPSEWDLVDSLSANKIPPVGSFLLIAHHIDATYGNIKIIPITL